jgi:hypothetical protein
MSAERAGVAVTPRARYFGGTRFDFRPRHCLSIEVNEGTVLSAGTEMPIHSSYAIAPRTYSYCHVVRLKRGFGQLDLFGSLQVVTTNNYNTIAYFHTLQITIAHAKSLLASSVFTRSFLATASNNGFRAQVPYRTDSQLNVMLCYDRRSVGQSVLVPSTHLGLTTRFLLLSDSCGFVDVERSL